MRTPMAAIAVGRGLTKRPPDPHDVGMCLRETRQLYDVASRYRTAAAAYAATNLRGHGPAPAGAIHWWTGGGGGAGHVALGVTPARVLSIDNVRAGGLDLVTLARIARTWHALTYRGWSRDLNGITVLPLVRLSTAMTDPAAVRTVTGALVDEHLLAHTAEHWTPEVLAAYAHWQARAGFGPPTPGHKGPADGLTGIRSLTMLGLRRGFATTA